MKARHRTIAFAAALLLALVAAGVIRVVDGSAYRCSQSIVIVPPEGTGAAPNLLLHLDPALASLGTVLATALNAPDGVAAVDGRDGGTSHQVSAVSGTTGPRHSPLLEVAATGPTAADARHEVAVVVTRARAELRSLQEQAVVPVTAQARLLQVGGPSRARSVGGATFWQLTWTFLGVLAAGAIVIALVSSRRSPRPTGFAPPEPIAARPPSRTRRAARKAAAASGTPRSR